MKLKKLTLTAILTAGALVVFVLENQLPPLTPLPGIKPGLANIFSLFALWAVGAPQALCVLLLRVVLGSILTGQIGALAYSLTGGLAAFGVMLLLKRFLPERQLWVVSVFGAMAHSLGQMAIALLLTQTKQLICYLPVLLAASVAAGAFTGLAAQLVLRQLRRNRLL